MAQFLFEAMAIALSGGLVGLVVAALIVFGVDAIPTEGNEAMQYILNPRLSWPIALICVGILIGVGLLAGILPARRAPAVDPGEGLRDAWTSSPFSCLSPLASPQTSRALNAPLAASA